MNKKIKSLLIYFGTRYYLPDFITGFGSIEKVSSHRCKILMCIGGNAQLFIECKKSLFFDQWAEHFFVGGKNRSLNIHLWTNKVNYLV